MTKAPKAAPAAKVVVTETRAQHENSEARKAREAQAKKAMEEAPEIRLTQGSDIPVTETDPAVAKQHEAEKALEKKQVEFAKEHAERARELQPGPGAPPVPIDEPNKVAWKPIRLVKAYTPLTSYRVVEGETPRIHSALPGRVLDKVQAGSTIELPADEARRLVDARLAERADPF